MQVLGSGTGGQTSSTINWADYANSVAATAKAAADAAAKQRAAQDAAPSPVQTAPVVAPPVVAPLPVAPNQQDWLNSDMESQAEKASSDQTLQSELASMLYDKNNYDQDENKQLTDLNTNAPKTYQAVADKFSGQGLLNSSLYDKADDDAYQGVATQRNTLNDALADYTNQYNTGVQAKQQANETNKRNIEASALSRYAQLYTNGYQPATGS